MDHLAFDRYGPWEREPGDGYLDKDLGPKGRSIRENSPMRESVRGEPQVPAQCVGFSGVQKAPGIRAG